MENILMITTLMLLSSIAALSLYFSYYYELRYFFQRVTQKIHSSLFARQMRDER